MMNWKIKTKSNGWLTVIDVVDNGPGNQNSYIVSGGIVIPNNEVVEIDFFGKADAG